MRFIFQKCLECVVVITTQEEPSVRGHGEKPSGRLLVMPAQE